MTSCNFTGVGAPGNAPDEAHQAPQSKTPEIPEIPEGGIYRTGSSNLFGEQFPLESTAIGTDIPLPGQGEFTQAGGLNFDSTTYTGDPPAPFMMNVRPEAPLINNGTQWVQPTGYRGDLAAGNVLAYSGPVSGVQQYPPLTTGPLQTMQDPLINNRTQPPAQCLQPIEDMDDDLAPGNVFPNPNALETQQNPPLATAHLLTTQDPENGQWLPQGEGQQFPQGYSPAPGYFQHSQPVNNIGGDGENPLDPAPSQGAPNPPNPPNPRGRGRNTPNSRRRARPPAALDDLETANIPAAPVVQQPLEPWMTGRTLKFLEYMANPNRETRNLMHWDRITRTPQGLLVANMTDLQRFNALLQVIQARAIAKKAWFNVNQRYPSETEMHWPTVKDLETDPNGVVLVYPERLVNPVPANSHKFVTLANELLGRNSRGEPEDETRFLFICAGERFCGNSDTGLVWKDLFPGTMSVDLDAMCGAMERNFGCAPKCTKAVLQLMTNRNQVTLDRFCESTRIFGKWWDKPDKSKNKEEPIRSGIEKATDDRVHFYIATCEQANNLVQQYNLGYLIRPRCSYDERSGGALWPFALTMVVGGQVVNYVVSFSGGKFFLRDEDNNVMEDTSVVRLAHRFAVFKGVSFL